MSVERYREVSLSLEDPTVTIEVGDYGSVTARLSAHRVNNRGVFEEYRIDLNGVGVWELACIARSAAKGLQKKAACDISAIEGRLEYASGVW